MCCDTRGPWGKMEQLLKDNSETQPMQPSYHWFTILHHVFTVSDVPRLKPTLFSRFVPFHSTQFRLATIDQECLLKKYFTFQQQMSNWVCLKIGYPVLKSWFLIPFPHSKMAILRGQHHNPMVASQFAKWKINILNRGKSCTNESSFPVRNLFNYPRVYHFQDKLQVDYRGRKCRTEHQTNLISQFDGPHVARSKGGFGNWKWGK